jgi:wyosine [tRNA(Phe)-imidazoG37] synthetase (radical SAM superfamily)
VKTAEVRRAEAKTLNMPPLEDVLKSVEEALKLHREIDYITFSGNGEPTLHPMLCEIVEGVKKLRDAHAAGVPLAILSNSSTLTIPEVRRALRELDVCIMKLDAGDEDTFRRINRPHGDIVLKDIIKCLNQMEHIIIQTVFVKGTVSNLEKENLERWLEAISEIQPAEVQIYSTHRPVLREREVKEVPRHVLNLIAERVRACAGVKGKVKVY